MIRVVSFIGSAAGDASHTKELSDRLAKVLSEQADVRGETISYECMTADNLRISFCRSCNSCFGTGTCPLDDADDIGDLKRRMLEADIILFGTPVYLAEMSGAAKCVLDRISFWSHRLELAGKADMALVTASNNHGPEVEQRLRELLQLMGLSMPEGLCLQLHARPHLGNPEEAEPLIADAAARLLDAWDDPAACLTELQELYWKGLALKTRRAMMRHYLSGAKVSAETLVLDERRIASYESFADYVRRCREEAQGDSRWLDKGGGSFCQPAGQ
ncbi:MAG: flavodoxin family protein [Atopobiaceae bacterium]|nr:flavodoxin family protein [Atopobiaceae bacterium]